MIIRQRVSGHLSGILSMCWEFRHYPLHFILSVTWNHRGRNQKACRVSLSFPVSFPGSVPCPSSPPRAKQTAAAVLRAAAHKDTVGLMERQVAAHLAVRMKGKGQCWACTQGSPSALTICLGDRGSHPLWPRKKLRLREMKCFLPRTHS